MTDITEHNATPRAELERLIMDANIPKNEAEWWAKAEIERLTAWLQEIAREQSATDADYFRALARAALAGQPLAGKEPKP